MRKLALGTLSILAFLALGCARTANEPGPVAVEFMSRLSQLNFNGAAELATEESKPMLLMMSGFLVNIPEDQQKELEEQKKAAAAQSIQVVESVEDGDKATVTLKIGEEDQKVDLQKVNGEWKVNFSKNL